jgi:predicted enzyme related to lactoylglutathione lyase
MGFLRYELRTTDVEAARAFYADLLGPERWSHRELSVIPLPERAAAMGAPSHWLGHAAVPDVSAAVAKMVSLGGQLLGPPLPPAPSRAVLRDPLGAVLAVTSESAPAAPSEVVVFEQLHTTDVPRASAVYAALFGWTSPAIADTARRPGVHPHWMFHFRVDDLDASLAKVRALGGKALEPMTTPTGHLVAACEDPQGAAFALTQTRDGA